MKINNYPKVVPTGLRRNFKLRSLNKDEKKEIPRNIYNNQNLTLDGVTLFPNYNKIERLHTKVDQENRGQL